jgi:hypothetical protein
MMLRISVDQLPFVEAEINYVGDMKGERPYVDVSDFSRNRLALESHRVRIRDARPIQKQLSLDSEGFVLARHRTRLTDLRDEATVNGAYLAEIQELVKSIAGASAVIVSEGPVVRFNSPKEQNVVRPARFSHTDYTQRTGRMLLPTSYDRTISDPERRKRATQDLIAASVAAAGSKRTYRRVLAIQTWRALSGPPQDVPLALCAASSVTADDIVEADFVTGLPEHDGATLEFCLYHPSPKHQWFYFPRLEQDEVILFTGFDFDAHAVGRVLHTAFDDPTCPPDAPPRASIEARTFAFFED